MNKFAAIVLLAFVAVAGAQLYDDTYDMESQAAAVIPSDDEEVAYLSEDHKQFGDFCKQSRDWVRSEIRTSSNRLASSVFQTLFKSAEALGQDTIDTVDKASSRIGTQLRSPDAEIAPAESAVEEILANAQQQIKNGEAQPKAFLTGFKATIGAISQNVANFVGARFEQLQAKANPATLWATVVEVCKSAEHFEYELKKQFEEYKASINAGKVNYEDVQCVSTRRVSRVEGICKFAAAARPTLPKLLNFGRN